MLCRFTRQPITDRMSMMIGTTLSCHCEGIGGFMRFRLEKKNSSEAQSPRHYMYSNIPTNKS